MTPEERYEDLVDDLTGVDGVSPPAGGSGFGRSALRYRFDANKGTPMKEWFSLDPGSALPWPPLAREALDFAIAQSAR
jgi:hypothetical protein